jgi:hypothetical protein
MTPPPARPFALLAGLVLAVAAAAVLAGCGATRGSAGDGFALTVTRDFGATTVAELQRQPLPTPPALAAILDGYGRPRARESLFVNGIAADKAPAKLTLHGDDRVWLDQHDSAVATRPSAVVGAFPEPFLHGVDGKRLPVRVECDDPRSGPCAAVADKLVSLGVIAGRSVISRSAADETLRVLVGPWSRLRGRELEADSIDAGPASSGVFAHFDDGGRRLVVLDAAGRPARTLGAGTGFIATTTEPERRPLWFVTGTDAAGVAAAARAFDESVLADRFALAISRDLPVAVPQPSPRR